MGPSVAAVTLILILFCLELFTASFVLPSLPAAFFLATPTLDLLATPTGTISAALAAQIALTPHPLPGLADASGCVADKLIITSPTTGTQISRRIDLLCTVTIPDLG